MYRNIAICNLQRYVYSMGVTNTEIFTEQQNSIADLAKAFAHPARVAILQVLISRKACVCGDLVDFENLDQFDDHRCEKV